MQIQSVTLRDPVHVGAVASKHWASGMRTTVTFEAGVVTISDGTATILVPIHNVLWMVPAPPASEPKKGK